MIRKIMFRRVILLVAPLPVGAVFLILAGRITGNGFVNLAAGTRSLG